MLIYNFSTSLRFHTGTDHITRSSQHENAVVFQRSNSLLQMDRIATEIGGTTERPLNMTVVHSAVDNEEYAHTMSHVSQWCLEGMFTRMDVFVPFSFAERLEG